MAATPPDRVGDVDVPGLEPDVDAPGLEPDIDVDDEDAFGHPVPGVLPTDDRPWPTGDDDDLDV